MIHFRPLFAFLVGFLTFCPNLARSLHAEGRSPESKSIAAVAATNEPIRINTTLPHVEEPKPMLSFSPRPAREEFFRARLFEEPLVPIDNKEPSPADNAALAAALLGYAGRSTPDDFSSLNEFVKNNPESPWCGAVLANLGLEAYRSAHYSLSLQAWKEAWRRTRDAKPATARAVADRVASELAGLYARLGRMQELGELLAEVNGRVFAGPGGEKIEQARGGLWSMENEPGVCFRCGPLALLSIQLAHDAGKAQPEVVRRHASPPTGFSLPTVAKISREMGMNYRMAYRAPGATVVVPSVVHWKVGHYAAIVRREGGRFLIQDPTFRNDVWATEAALDAEASGYFLISEEQPLPMGWRAVDESEGSAVFGKGNVKGPGPDGPGPKPPKPCPGNGSGMPVPSIGLLYVSLILEDTPLGYEPPIGPSMNFKVHYNQRDSAQPANFAYSNLGPKWTFEWVSYIQDDPTNPNANATYYRMGGFTRLFTGFSPATQSYALQPHDHTKLIRTSPTSYEMRWNDGSRAIFNQPDGSSGNSRKIFLKQYIDPSGEAITFTYDANLRIAAIADALGQVTTLSYELAADIYKITKITDPFGRFATLEYDVSGRLAKITDVLGLASEFKYDGASDFIQALVTPYGTTTFTKSDVGINRSLEILYPDGNRERAEFNQDTTLGIPNSEAAHKVPTGVSARNEFLWYRNTYYWSRIACALAYGDYTKAKVYHWLHTPDLNSAASTLESVKEPLENRVWYDYAGQAAPYIVGTTDLPRHVGRVLDDGSTQLYTYEYNDFGRKTKEIDPLGRTFSYIYATNGIDLLETRMTRNGANELLQRITYNTRHRPLTITDAAGQTTTFTYNSRGQVATLTNAKGEMTTYGYDSKGYAIFVDGPLPGVVDRETFTYDAVGRTRTRTSSSGYTLVFDHDDLDHLTRVTFPDGTYQAYNYTRLDLTQLVDRAGRTVNREYDSVRQLTKETDPLGRVTSYDWCKCGEMKSITDPMGRTTRWRHDVQARRTAKEYPDGSQVRYLYEGTTSRLQRQIDEKQQETHVSYNRDNSVASITYLKALAATPNVSFRYDADYPRVVSMSDGTGTTLYRYGTIEEPPSLGAGLLASVDGPLMNDTLTYRYDELGRRVSTAINGVASTVTYDKRGRKAAESGPIGNVSYVYDGATSRLASKMFPNGLITDYQYGPLQQDEALQRITHRVGPIPVSEFLYTRNLPAQKIVTCSQQAGTQRPVVHSFIHDDADQLIADAMTSGEDSVGHLLYSYDPDGNRLKEVVNGTTTTFSYNALNQLVAQEPENRPGSTYGWDGANRLVEVVNGNTSTQFTYDGLGRRVTIRQVVKGVETSLRRFVWNDSQICEERNAAGAVTKRYFHDGVKIETGPSPGTYYYTRDHLGSINELVDAGGIVRARYRYDPFGRATRVEGDLEADFGFTGMLWSPEAMLNLTYYRAYDANAARWLSRDPLHDAEAEEGINLYAYVRNDPVHQTDSLGLKVDGCCQAEKEALAAAEDFLSNYYYNEKMRRNLGQGILVLGGFNSYVFYAIPTVATTIGDPGERELQDAVLIASTKLQECLAHGCGKKPNCQPGRAK